MQTVETKNNKSKTVKFVKGFLFLFVAVSAAMIGGYFWLQGEAGRGWLKAELTQILNNQFNEKVQIAELTGNIFSEFTLKNVRIENSVTAESLYLSWQPLSLITGHINIDTIRLTGGNLNQLPTFKPASDAAQVWTPPSLSVKMASFDVRSPVDYVSD